MEFGVDGEIVVKVRKVTFDGIFASWEAELTGPTGDINVEVTGPDFWGALDGCLEYLNYEDGMVDQKWLNENANGETK